MKVMSEKKHKRKNMVDVVFTRTVTYRAAVVAVKRVEREVVDYHPDGDFSDIPEYKTRKVFDAQATAEAVRATGLLGEYEVEETYNLEYRGKTYQITGGTTKGGTPRVG